MRSLFFLALTTTGLIFFLQNRQLVTLFFLGTSQQSALASLTLPLGLWVVVFSAMGIVTSLIISGLSRIGQPQRRPINQSRGSFPQRPDPEPAPRSPSPPPRYQAPEPDPPVNQTEWDWDDPIPEVADWDVKPAPSPPKPAINAPPEDFLRDRSPSRPARFPSDFAAPRPGFIAPEPTPEEPEIGPESEPQRREPLPDLRQFEAPQTPTETKRQGTIYSQQYRPARSPTGKVSPKQKPDPQSKPVYDAPYRVINAANNPPLVNAGQPEDLEDDEEWI
ncbi:MAG: hypothetical protein RLZZ490_481 [Cyanobacteriota bacterium]